MILRCFIYYCGKFQTDTISQTIFGRRIRKTSLGKMKTLSSHLKLSDNKLSNNKLSNNKLSDNNLASELVENRTFLNQSQARKL